VSSLGYSVYAVTTRSPVCFPAINVAKTD